MDQQKSFYKIGAIYPNYNYYVKKKGAYLRTIEKVKFLIMKPKKGK